MQTLPRIMSSISWPPASDLELNLSGACDLVLALHLPVADVEVHEVIKVIEQMAPLQSEAPTTVATVFAHVATLISPAPPVSSSASARPQTFLIIHVSDAAVARRTKLLLDFLRMSTPEFSFLHSIGWVHRSVVEQHSLACSSTSNAVMDPPPSKLELLLSAKRWLSVSRKRPLEVDTDPAHASDSNDQDELACIVLYLPSNSQVRAPGEPTQEDSDNGQNEVLAAMERLAAELRWPITHHYLDSVKQRFFLQCPSSSDAAKVRESFISVAKSGSVPLLRGVITSSTMKVCSLRDMRHGARKS